MANLTLFVDHDDVDDEDEVLSQYLHFMYIVVWIFGFPDCLISWHFMKAVEKPRHM